MGRTDEAADRRGASAGWVWNANSRGTWVCTTIACACACAGGLVYDRGVWYGLCGVHGVVGCLEEAEATDEESRVGGSIWEALRLWGMGHSADLRHPNLRCVGIC